MTDQVEVTYGALNRLRHQLASVVDRQTAGLRNASNDLDSTKSDIEQARRLAQGVLARAEAAYAACIRAALAAEEGKGPDCRGLAHEVQRASVRLAAVEGAANAVEQAARLFRPSAARHREYLSHAISTMQNGLLARMASIEQYQSFVVSATTGVPTPSAINAERPLADRIGTQGKYGRDAVFRVPNPSERLEESGRGEKGD